MKGSRYPKIFDKNCTIGYIGENINKRKQIRKSISIRNIQKISKEHGCEKNKLNTDFCEFDT